MTFYADLHVHSRHSRATSKDMDLERLYTAAQIKGVSLVGTGDFTHPQWFEEIGDKLVMDDHGLFRLRPDIADACDRTVPGACRRPVRFVLQAEISNIYKKNERTRKNHNLVYLPDLESAARFNRRLERIGNIHSDGRPILGLDARDLLEITLETSDRGMLIPAHVWTPWFSLLGSKSGFDTVDACFGDLTPHIHALETGLSSDPPMNWRVSGLDGLTLVSNSDAHSPGNLGREATVFNTELSYDDIFNAIRTGDSKAFGGTLEFYPEEGKYHLDGHRKCQVRLTPRESLALDNICPVCGKEMTLGVFHRVVALSDRRNDDRPDQTHPFTNMVSLPHVLAEIFNVGSTTKTVRQHYDKIVSELGSELPLLTALPIDEIDRLCVPLLGEAVERVRSGRLHIAGGYDGVFGTISIFTEDERASLAGQQHLFCMPASTPKPTIDAGRQEAAAGEPSPAPPGNGAVDPPKGGDGLNDDQKAAVAHGRGPLIIVAGPGTGKTLTLTHRVAHLVNVQQVDPASILAVTFTNKAAEEMTHRLNRLLPDRDGENRPLVATFHAFCHRLLSESAEQPFSIIADEDRGALVKAARSLTSGAETAFGGRSPSALLEWIVTAKQRLVGPGDDLSDLVPAEARLVFQQVYSRYQEFLELQRLLDFEDLIRLVVMRLESDAHYKLHQRSRYPHVLVDEYQDINYGQYRLIRALCPPRSDLCVIGDPDQSIYGFRGANHAYFRRFTDDYPDAAVVTLTRNYRSTATILSAAYQVVDRQKTTADRCRPRAMISDDGPIWMIDAQTDRSEAVAIGKAIERLMGGTGFQAVDFGAAADGGGELSVAFSDIAVLMRTHQQGNVIEEVFSDAGIPCRRASRQRLMDDRTIVQIISLLRLSAGMGGLADLGRVISVVEPGISPATMRTVSAWCFEHALSVDNLRYSVRRYPIEGLTQKRQQRLYDFLGVPFLLGQETVGKPVVEIITHIVSRTRLKRALRQNPSALEAYEDLLAMAADHGADTPGFVTAVMLHADTDQYARQAQKVSILTAHAAKGLEFPVVFIVGCNDGIFPFRSDARGADGDEDEERRLFFVAATRARSRLYLCHAGKRLHRGRQHTFALSPFLRDIDRRLTAEVVSRRGAPPKPVQEQLRLF